MYGRARWILSFLLPAALLASSSCRKQSSTVAESVPIMTVDPVTPTVHVGQQGTLRIQFERMPSDGNDTGVTTVYSPKGCVDPSDQGKHPVPRKEIDSTLATIRHFTARASGTVTVTVTDKDGGGVPKTTTFTIIP